MEYSFIWNMSTVSSPAEITIILNDRTSTLFYDPDRSHADGVASCVAPSLSVGVSEIDGEACSGC